LQYAPEGVVEHLQATEGVRQSPDAPKHLYRPGAACRLIAGPFRDHDAVVAEINGANALVSIMLFGELRRVAVPLESLAPRAD
jgi:transcription antitermination factor NusG